MGIFNWRRQDSICRRQRIFQPKRVINGSVPNLHHPSNNSSADAGHRGGGFILVPAFLPSG
jgi:hypothetical protein